MAGNNIKSRSKVFEIAVIGGAGRMGAWFCRFGVSQGLNIIAADQDAAKLKELPVSPHLETTTDNHNAVSRSRIILISVPLDVFEAVIKDIAPHIRHGSIVMDGSSIKVRAVAVMRKYIKDCIIIGAHPLFGPNIETIKGQNIIFTPTGEKETAMAKELAGYVENCGAKVNLMTPEEHDKMMAVVQGLSHFTAIAAADALAGLGELKEMKAAATTTFNIFLNYIESVIGDDPELYAAIQMEHPEMPGIYNELTQSVDKFAGYVKDKDTRSFVKRMRELKEFLGK
jgi:prephenate dehydrogenase